MAIQLDCPACLATLRLPDAAMGTVADCPKCRKRMRVPVVTKPLLEAATAFTDSPRFAPRLPDHEPGFFTDDEPESDSVPAAPINPHAVLARRNKRRMSRGWIGVILALVVATVGVSATYWWSNRANIVRTADASVIANATLSRDLTSLEVNVTPADWAAIELSLEQNPASPNNAEMRLRMEKSARGLQLSLTPTSERMIVAVPTASITELQDPAIQAALNEAWKRAVSQALTEMSATIQQAVASGVVPALAKHGTPVGVEGLAGATGYHLQAVVGTKAYPCVFEDANYHLYFLVPTGTKSLAVIPREIGARKVLPEKMRITATVK